MFHVLVVEDDAKLRSLFCTVLANSGYLALPAPDGEQALSILDSEYVDLIISDIMMPGMDGYELIDRLRDSGFTMPILIITAKEAFEDKQRGFLAGADDYIRDMWLNEKLNTLLACLMAESWQPSPRQDQRRPARRDIAPVRAYVEEHCAEKLTLESVAEHFFLNKHYLARLFKEQYGVSVNGYLTQVRITRAKQMLRFTDKPIALIGAECGLDDANYFSRIFKKVEGVTPKQYRDLW